MSASESKFHFRLVLLGSHGTGKTSILNRFLFKKFETKYRPTVEDLFCKDFDLGSIEIKVDFLDTSGSMQFPAMRRLSITTGSAFLIVYSLDDESSYEVVKMCMAEIQEIRPDFQEIPIVFAGNKCDIPRERRKVSKEVVSNYVHYELPRLRAKVIECSCRDNINIENLFKAYLSLAKVSLSSAVSANLKTKSSSNSTTNNNNNNNQHQPPVASNTDTTEGGPNDGGARRASSMKDALGVRKSCDASIISPRRSVFTFTGSGGAASTKTTSPIIITTTTSSAINRKTSQHGAPEVGSNTFEETVNLETAIQSKLNVSQSAKPRSRSLIWRPARKSRTAAESPDCRIS